MFEHVTYDPGRIPYGRRGTFFYLNRYEENDQSRVWACALYSGLDQAGRGGKLFPIRFERDGIELESEVTATPSCTCMTYEGGSARLCLQRGSILRIEAHGAQVVLSPALKPHEIAKSRNDGSWEVVMGPLPKLLFCPVTGTMEAKTGYDVLTSRPEETRFIFRPDEKGNVDLAVHLYIGNAWRMKEYPPFDSCVRDLEHEFGKYLETVPELPGEFETARILEAYIIWSHIMEVDGTEIIYMNKGVHRCTSSWQQCYHAMAQYNAPEFAWKLLLSVFRWQDDYGMLPDCIFDSYRSFSGCKPPFHGVALAFLSRYTDLSFAPVKEIAQLYRGLSDWVFWWLSYRDTDHDGIAQYDTADESGFDDSSFFRLGGPIETPDLAAYLILAMEQLSSLAGKLGKTYEEREWTERAERMLKETVSFFWNGDSFVPRMVGTHEPVRNGSIMQFIPLLLGKRLPAEITDRLTASLAEEGRWLTPYGLAGEDLLSPDYHDSGWSAGPILAPAQLMVVLGLYECGKDELAAEISRRYCRALVRAGSPMVMNAVTGLDVSELRWGPKYPNRMAWTALVFLLLGSLLERTGM